MDARFYYADEHSRPVGPLTLEEIRKLAAAGVVLHDVMVCEAEGDNWRSLDTIPVKLSGRCPPKAVVSSPVRTNPPQDPEQVTKGLKWAFTSALVSSLIAFSLDAISTRASIDGQSPMGEAPALLLLLVLLASILVSVGANLALVYLLVRAIPERHRFTTPGKAAGFCLIPVFSLYWIFRLSTGLVSSIRQWVDEFAPSLSWRVSKLMPFALAAAGIGAFSEFLTYLDMLGSFASPDAGTMKESKAVLYFVYAASDAVSFYFLIHIVHLLRGILTDESDVEELLAQSIPSWALHIGRSPWGLVAGFLIFGFLVAAMTVWS